MPGFESVFVTQWNIGIRPLAGLAQTLNCRVIFAQSEQNIFRRCLRLRRDGKFIGRMIEMIGLFCHHTVSHNKSNGGVKTCRIAIIILPCLQIGHLHPVNGVTTPACGPVKIRPAIISVRRHDHFAILHIGKNWGGEKILVVRHRWRNKCLPVKFFAFGFPFMFVIFPCAFATPVFFGIKNRRSAWRE